MQRLTLALMVRGTPAAVNTLAVTNRATLNVLVPNPIVDWLPVASAKSYNVYRATSLAGGAYGAFERIATVTNSDFTDNVNFVDLDLKVSYKYMVRPVSRDNIESADSTSVAGTDIAQDNTTPSVASVGIVTGSRTVTVFFDEEMDEASAETLTHYVLAATTGANAPATAPTIPALSSAIYNRLANSVTLTYASNVPAGTTLTVTGVTDVAGNVVTTDTSGKTAKVTSSINYFGGTTASVDFTAQMNKADAELIANYTLTTTTVPPVTTPPTTNAVVTNAVLNGTGTVVTLTFDKALSPCYYLNGKRH
jgi:hypothetical protein